MEESIFEQLQKNAPHLNNENIEEYVNPICKKLSNYSKNLSYEIYSSPKYLDSWEQEVQQKVSQVLRDFYIRFQYWKQNRKFEPYLKSSLINLSKNLRNVSQGLEIDNVYYCTFCKEFLDKLSYLEQIGYGKYKCNLCEIDSSVKENSFLHKMRNIFRERTSSGYFCLECYRFIPSSTTQGDILICPFEDCFFSDSIFNLELSYNPRVGRIKNYFESKEDFSHIKDDASDSNPESLFVINEKMRYLEKIVRSTLFEQKKKEERFNLINRVQKITFYEAFEKVLDQRPEDMILFLSEDKKSQLKPFIFQEYIKLIGQKLPFKVGKEDVWDLLDPSLNLFLGISTFETVVKNNKIKNETLEKYVGGRKNIDYGPCFFGKIISLKIQNNCCLDKIKYHSFSEIVLKDDSFHQLPATITHYRIASHYQLGNLVFLQQILKNIRDKIKIKLRNKYENK